ncbi:MAG: hypothetical protein OSB00_10375 [Sphingomonas bacterium]|nr:hypothetical protein [Sphingomonas bacterium]
MSHYRPLRLAVDALPTGAFTTPTLTNAPLHRSTLVTTKASPPPALPMPADAWDGPDAGDYDWVPVLRRPRSDGWSPDKQRIFIETLADTACVTIAAQAVAMSASSAYRLRRARDGGAFAAAWDAALEQGAQVLISTAFDRAIHGSEEPVFDRDGNRVGRRFRQNDRLLMFLLRKLHPELFGDAGRDAPAAGSVRARRRDRSELADLIAALSPPRPADPAALMDADALAVALDVADLCEGDLPPWLRRRQAGEDALVPDPVAEARLDALKEPPRTDDEDDEDASCRDFM